MVEPKSTQSSKSSGSNLVLCVLGVTGNGKSSLLNAIAGFHINDEKLPFKESD